MKQGAGDDMKIFNKLRIVLIFILISALSISIPINSLTVNSADNTNLYEKWNYKANEGDFLEEIKFDSDGSIFLTNNGRYVSYIISLDSQGKLIWDYYLKEREFTHSFITKDYIYLVSTFRQNNQLVLLNKDTGRKVKEITLDLRADEYINKITANYDGNIFVTTEDKFIIFDKNGKRKWQLNISVPFNFTPVIGPNGNVYVLGYLDDTHYRLYSIKPKGAISWSTSLNFQGYSFAANIKESPILFDKDGTLYIKDEFTVYSIDERDGDINWKYSFDKYNGNYSSYNFLLEDDRNYFDDVDANRSQSLVNKVDDKIILYSKYEMIALDANNGKEEWYFDRGRYPIKDIVELDGRIYAVFDRLYAFDEDGDIEWSFNLGDKYTYSNIELQVDRYRNLYLYEYGYNAGKGTLYYISNSGNLLWKNGELPADRHDWHMTENGPIYITEKYYNGQYQSQLYIINPDKTISQVKLDGFVTKVIDKGWYIYFLTNAKLYAFTYPYYVYDINDNTKLPIDNNSCYTYIDDNLNNTKGYKLNKDWDYKLNTDGYDVKQLIDEDNNVYLSFYDGDFIAYIYSLDRNGKINWKYNLDRESFSDLAISDNYLHLYDGNYENNGFLLLNKETGKKIKDYKLYFSNDVNDITFDYQGDIYISTENSMSKYNYNGYKLWNISANIPSSTKNVIGPDGTIYVINHNYKSNYQLYAVRTSGSIKWRTNLTFDNYSLDEKEYPIQFDNNGDLYILNDDDYTLYSIDAANGNINFKYTGREDFNLLLTKDIVWTVDNKVVIYSDKQIYALNTDNGKTAWSFSSPSKLQDIAAQEDSIYVIFDKLYELNKYGKKVWTYDLKGKQYKDSGLVINDYGFIYAIEYKYNDKGGLIHALDDRKLKWQYNSSTSTKQSWYLLDDVPIFTTYNRGSRSSEINLVNNSGISKVVVSGEIVDITEIDNTIYVLTDKQLYKFDKNYGYLNQTGNICSFSN